MQKPSVLNNQRVAIVGAGPAGLATAKALKALGIDFQIYEKHSETGGVWDIDNPGTPMYPSAHFISSKTQSGHYDYPMPDHYPDYPSHCQILNYIRSFAKDHELYKHIRFNSSVDQVIYQEGHWQLSSHQNDGTVITEPYRWLICANGTNWIPNQPRLTGHSDFEGEIYHSVNYAGSERLTGKKVLVIGAGNSGVDIACDAAFSADKAYISMRRGYHIVPKHVFGVPVDVFGNTSKWLPLKMQQWIFGKLLRLLTGDLERLGLKKPDHKILSSHPIINSQLMHYLQHGDIQATTDINYLSAKHAHLMDGSRINVDTIVLATGYQWRIPFLDSHFYQWNNNRPQTFLKIFNKQHPTLFINGFVETNAGAYKLFDEMAHLIARTIHTQATDSQAAAKVQSFIQGAEPDISGKLDYIKSDRHTGYTNIDAYRAAIKLMCRAMEWPYFDEKIH